MSFGSSKDKKNAANSIQQTGSELYDRTKATDQEESQYTGSFDIGNLLKQIFQYQAGVGSAPQGYQNPTQQYNQDPLNKSIYDQTLDQSQNPDKYYQSTLQPQLAQAQDTINSYYQKRGLLNSGLAIESMGRAGVDLAIQEAQQRMAARQQGLQNAQSVSQNIYSNSQGNLANLANLYSGQQSYGQGALNRQAQGAISAAGYQAYPSQAALGSYYGGVAAQQALPGQLIGAAGKVGAAAAMCWVASELFGGWFHPKTMLVRKYMVHKAPNWLRENYIKYGEAIANFISNKPILKLILKPLFNLFAKWGE